MPDTEIVFRTCPFCEATCGLEVHLEGREVKVVRGDRDDVFSAGFICPKGSAVKQLEIDPDRLRAPAVREGDAWRDVSWDDAFEEIERRLLPIIEEHGKDAVAVYLGNPTVHSLDLTTYARVLLQSLGTTNVYSASTVDQMPKQVSSALMFGGGLTVPVPDLDRTDHLLVLGANPFASNGSLMTAPDVPGRLRAIRERGGRIVVVDPRRSKTAEEADEHLFIRPGTDAHLLFALVHTIVTEGLAALGDLEPHVTGVDEVAALAAPFTPERVAAVCGIDADTIRRTARELAAAPTAAVYGRIGTCTQEFGTLASWLVDVLNVLTGNLDRPGGAMFTLPAASVGGPHVTRPAGSKGPGSKGKGIRFGRRRSRVRDLPETFGEFPVATLADEIETPGPGQIKALITIAGNPARSTPDSARLERALGSLELMVSLDIYRNETTRHADVILPGPSLLTRGHYDVALYQLAVRNVANWSPPVRDPDPGEQSEADTLLRMAAVVTGQGRDADLDALDDFVVTGLVDKAVAREGSNVEGRDPAELMGILSARRRAARMLDLMIRTGPYGDGFGADAKGLSLDVLEANPHGVDLGPLEPRIPDVLRTPTGLVELAPEPIVADVARLEAAIDRDRDAFVLVGRRDLRSNNSWMHNLETLVKGKARCTLQVHPDDATSLGLVDGADARVASSSGSVTVPVEVTDGIMRGVVSIPHGWGHDADGTALGVAAQRPGVNSNVLTPSTGMDPLSGNAVLNGIPVEVVPA